MTAPRWDESGGAAATIVDDDGQWAAQVHPAGAVQGPAFCPLCGRGAPRAFGAGRWDLTLRSGPLVTEMLFELPGPLCGPHFCSYVVRLLDPANYGVDGEWLAGGAVR